jgi:hypothetical protein
MKPFRVHAEWIYYAHFPGSEDEQPLACRLIELHDAAPAGAPVLISDPELVREVIDVAELYTCETDVQYDDRLWWRGYPANVIRRAKKWLRDCGQRQVQP